MKKLISIVVLIFGVTFTSFAQDSILVPDTLIYNSGEILLINVIGVKSDLIEYKKQNDSINVFYTSLSSVKELRLSDGSLIKGGVKVIPTLIDTLNREAYLEASLKLRVRDSIRESKNTKDIDKRKGHLLITTNLTTLIPSIRSPLELEGTVYGNNFKSIGVIYYPNSNFSIGTMLYKGSFSKESKMNFSNNNRNRPNPLFSEGVEVNFGFSTSKIKRFDWGGRMGVSFMNFAYREAIKAIKNRYNTVVEESYIQKKAFIIPFVGFESNLKLKDNFSISSAFGLKYDVKCFLYNLWPEEPYVLISNTTRTVIPETTSKRLQDPKLFFRFSLNYHIIPKKK